MGYPNSPYPPDPFGRARPPRPRRPSYANPYTYTDELDDLYRIPGPAPTVSEPVATHSPSTATRPVEEGPIEKALRTVSDLPGISQARGLINIGSAATGAVTGLVTSALGSDAYGRALQENAEGMTRLKPGEAPGFFESLRIAPAPGQVVAEAIAPGRPASMAGRIAKDVGGLVGDVIFDPLNLATGGGAAAAKYGKFARTGERVISELAPLLARVDRGMDAARATDLAMDATRAAENLTRGGAAVRATGELLGSAPAALVYGPEVLQATLSSGEQAITALREGRPEDAIEPGISGLMTGALGALMGRGVHGEYAQFKANRATASRLAEDAVREQGRASNRAVDESRSYPTFAAAQADFLRPDPYAAARADRARAAREAQRGAPDVWAEQPPPGFEPRAVPPVPAAPVPNVWPGEVPPPPSAASLTLKQRIERHRPQHTSDDLQGFNRGDAAVIEAMRQREAQAAEAIAAEVRDSTDADLLEAMSWNNQRRIAEGQGPAARDDRGAADYAAQEWLRRQQAQPPEVWQRDAPEEFDLGLQHAVEGAITTPAQPRLGDALAPLQGPGAEDVTFSPAGLAALAAEGVQGRPTPIRRMNLGPAADQHRFGQAVEGAITTPAAPRLAPQVPLPPIPLEGGGTVPRPGEQPPVRLSPAAVAAGERAALPPSIDVAAAATTPEAKGKGATIAGLPITLETAAGARRKPEFEPLQDHYGYFPRTKGKDKDQIDVYVQPGTPDDYDGPVFVIDQKKKDGSFDEHKVMLGYGSEAEAREAYQRNYPPDFDGILSVAGFRDPAQFQTWLKSGNKQRPAGVPPTGPDRRRGPRPGESLQDRRSRIGRDLGLEPESPGVTAHIELEDEAYTDALTGLGSRLAYQQAAPHAQAAVSFDVAGLGWFNDTHGHDAGDALLKVLGQAIKEEPDIEGFRTGGDEFYLIAKTREAAQRAAQSIQDRVAESRITYTTPDGIEVSWQGGRVDYGIGVPQDRVGATTTADRALLAERERLKAAGLRVPKGQRPPGLVEVTPAGREVPDRPAAPPPVGYGPRIVPGGRYLDQTTGRTVEVVEHEEGGKTTVRDRGKVRSKNPAKLIQLDERDQPIYPGEEDLTPDQRQALTEATGSIVRSIHKANKAEPTGRRPTLEGPAMNSVVEGGWYGVKSHKIDTPLEGFSEGPTELLSAVERDKGNRLELDVRNAIRKSEDFQEFLAREGDAAEGVSFDPREFGGEDDVQFARRPAPGQRGLPGIAGDVEPARPQYESPIQRDLFGPAVMLQGTEARTTEGREREGGLFTQERDAAERREAAGQRTIGQDVGVEPPPKQRPTPAEIRQRLETRDRERTQFLVKHGEVPFQAATHHGGASDTVIAHRSVKEPGKWQLTALEKGDPTGDVQFASYADMLKSAQREWGVKLPEVEPEEDVQFARRQQQAGAGDVDKLGFFSQLDRVAKTIPQAMSGKDMLRWLSDNKRGVRGDELKWTGLDDFLSRKGQQRVTPDEVREFLNRPENRIEVREVQLGAPKPLRFSEVTDTAEWGDPPERAWVASTGQRGLPVEIGQYGDNDFQIIYGDNSWEASTLEEAKRIALEQVQANLRGTRAGAKFGGPKTTLAGGENYRELLLTLPVKEKPRKLGPVPQGWEVRRREEMIGQDGNVEPWATENFYVLDGRTDVVGSGRTRAEAVRNSRQAMLTERPIVQEYSRVGFTDTHYGEEHPNLFAHIRFNDRRDADGKRVLFIEELQSDWAQKGRREGFKGDMPREMAPGEVYEENGRWYVRSLNDRTVWFDSRPEAEAYYQKKASERTVPKAPFVDDTAKWTELALKRMLRWASENGYDRVAWTTGKQQAERYDLSKQVERIEVSGRTNAGTGERSRAVTIRLKESGYPIELGVGNDGRVDNTPPGTAREFKGKHLSDVVGKEMADRIMAAETKFPSYEEWVAGQPDYYTVDFNQNGTWEVAGHNTVVKHSIKTKAEADAFAAESNDKWRKHHARNAYEYAKREGAPVRFEGEGLKVGGKGMSGYYGDEGGFAYGPDGRVIKDKHGNPQRAVVPTIMDRLGRKFGVKVGETRIATPKPREGAAANRNYTPQELERLFGNDPTALAENMASVHSMDVPAPMRESIMREGQARFAVRQGPLGFYSQLERVADKLPQAMKGADALRFLSDPKRGVKASELKWTGLDDYLRARAGERVTPQEIQDYVRRNAVEIREVPYGPSEPRFLGERSRQFVTRDQAVAAESRLEEALRLALRRGYPESGNQAWAEQQSAREAVELTRRVVRGGDAPAMRRASSILGQEEGAHPLVDEAVRAWDDYEAADREYDQHRGDRYTGRDAKWVGRKYNIPGGQRYRNLVLTLPGAPKKPDIDMIRPDEQAVAEHGARWEEIKGRYQAANDEFDKVMRQHGFNDPRYQAAYRKRDAVEEELSRLHKVMVEQTFARLPEPQRKAWQPEKTFRKDSHFPDDNPLAHVRFDERIDQDGKRVLFIQELQSDWAQRGRDRGFETPEIKAKLEQSRLEQKEMLRLITEQRRLEDGGGIDLGGGTIEQRLAALDRMTDDVPTKESLRDNLMAQKRIHEEGVQESWNLADLPSEAPFVGETGAWTELALKRMLRYAAENGFDRLAWTPGKVQAERYDLSKHIEEIRATRVPEGFHLRFTRLGERGSTEMGTFPANKLNEAVGKEMADKIRTEAGATPEGDEWQKVYSGLDLKVGGEDMSAYYGDKGGYAYGPDGQVIKDKHGNPQRAILPIVADRLGKKFGATVGETYLRDEGGMLANDNLANAAAMGADPVHAIDVTPEMKKGVMGEGMPLFAPRDTGDLRERTLAAERAAQDIGDGVTVANPYNYDELHNTLQREISGVRPLVMGLGDVVRQAGAALGVKPQYLGITTEGDMFAVTIGKNKVRLALPALWDEAVRRAEAGEDVYKQKKAKAREAAQTLDTKSMLAMAYKIHRRVPAAGRDMTLGERTVREFARLTTLKIAHEMAHIAAPKDKVHGEAFYETYRSMLRKLLAKEPQLRASVERMAKTSVAAVQSLWGGSKDAWDRARREAEGRAGGPGGDVFRPGRDPGAEVQGRPGRVAGGGEAGRAGPAGGVRGGRIAAAESEGGAPLRGRSSAERTPLSALHNISAEQLLKADKLGGLPMPSIAVSRGRVHEGFGDVTLVGRRSVVDPEADYRNKLYEADAYTTRVPSTTHKLDNKRRASLFESVPRREFGVLGDYGWDAAEEGPDRLFETLRTNPAFMAQYLRERGHKDLKPVMKEVDAPGGSNITEDKQLLAWVAAHPDLRDARPGEPDYAEFSKQVKEALGRRRVPEGMLQEDHDLQMEYIHRDLFDEATGDLFFSKADRLMTSLRTVIDRGPKSEIDRRGTEDALGKLIQGEDATGNDFKGWLRKKIEPLYKGEFVKVGRKQVPISLDAFVEAMSRRRGAAKEDNMTFGPGEARAVGVGKRKVDLERLRSQADRLVDEKDFRKWKEGADQIQSAMIDAVLPYRKVWHEGQRQYVSAEGFGSTWGALDDIFRAIGRSLTKAKDTRDGMRQALARYDFRGVPDEAVDLAVDMARTLRHAPTHYFEAKPERGVRLEEFAGAVIPHNADPKLREALERRGLKIETYDNATPHLTGGISRQQAVDRLLSTEDETLFSKAGKRRQLRADQRMPDEYEQLRKDVLNLRREIDSDYKADRVDGIEEKEQQLEAMEERLESAADEWYTERDVPFEGETATEEFMGRPTRDDEIAQRWAEYTRKGGQYEGDDDFLLGAFDDIKYFNPDRPFALEEAKAAAKDAYDTINARRQRLKNAPKSEPLPIQFAERRRARPIPPKPTSTVEKEVADAGRARAGGRTEGKPPDEPINLNRIAEPADVVAMESRVADALKVRGKTQQARQYRSWDEARERAVEAGLTEADFKRILKEKGALTDVEIEAGRMLRETAFVDARKKAAALERAKAEGKNTDAAERAYEASVTRAAGVLLSTVRAGGEAGRALAIHRKMSTAMTPEEAAKWRRKLADPNATKEQKAEARKRLEAPIETESERLARRLARERPGVSEEFIKRLLQTDPRDGRALSTLFRSEFRPSKRSKLYELWINGLLSGPPTHLANMTGNLVTQLLRIPEKAMAGALDAIGAKLTGRPRERFVGEAYADIMGIREGVKKGLAAMKQDWRDEFGIKDTGKLEHQFGKIGGRKGSIIRTPTRALSAEDQFFKALAATREARSMAYRKARHEGKSGRALHSRIEEILSDLDAHPEITEAMSREADYQTFTKKLGKFGQMMMAARDADPSGASSVIVPFMRTPINIAKYTLERTPLNFIRLAAKGANAEEYAKPLMGTLIGLSFALAAEEGLLTGGGPADPKKRQTLEATGWQPYSVKAGDQYISFKRIEPLAAIMGFAADLVETQDEDTQGDLVNKIVGSIAENLTDKTFLQGVEDLSLALSDPRRYASQWAKSLEGSLVPSIIGKVAQATDPTVRETSATDASAVLARIPGVSRTLEPKRKGTGEPIERTGTAFERFASPLQRSGEKGKEADLERAFLAADYTPSAPPRFATIPRQLGGSGQKIEWTRDELRYLRQVDEAVTDRLRRVVGDAKFRTLDPAQQKRYFENAYRRASDEAMKRMWARSRDLRQRASQAVREARGQA